MRKHLIRKAFDGWKLNTSGGYTYYENDIPLKSLDANRYRQRESQGTLDMFLRYNLVGKYALNNLQSDLSQVSVSSLATPNNFQPRSYAPGSSNFGVDDSGNYVIRNKDGQWHRYKPDESQAWVYENGNWRKPQLAPVDPVRPNPVSGTNWNNIATQAGFSGMDEVGKFQNWYNTNYNGNLVADSKFGSNTSRAFNGMTNELKAAWNTYKSNGYTNPTANIQVNNTTSSSFNNLANIFDKGMEMWRMFSNYDKGVLNDQATLNLSNTSVLGWNHRDRVGLRNAINNAILNGNNLTNDQMAMTQWAKQNNMVGDNGLLKRRAAKQYQNYLRQQTMLNQALNVANFWKNLETPQTTDIPVLSTFSSPTNTTAPTIKTPDLASDLASQWDLSKKNSFSFNSK